MMSTQTRAPHPMVSALSNKNFRLLWGGGSISVLGSQFSMIALPWLILQLTDDPQVLGLVLALAGLPRAIFILFGGAITDRFSPRRILLTCDWINFVLAGVIAALVITHTIQIWMVYILSLLSGLLAGFVIPAANSIAPMVLPDRDLHAGNSLSMGTSQLMGFIGPALAGVIIGSSAQSIEGVALAFAVDSLSFAISAITLGLMHGVERTRVPASGSSVKDNIWVSIAAAARYLFHDPSLRLIFIILCLTNLLFTGPLYVGIPVLADRRLVEGAAAFGLLMSGFAGGNLVGYLLGGALPKPTGRLFSLVIISVIASIGITYVAFGWVTSTWLDFALILLTGVGNGYIGLVLWTWIQQSTPFDMLGRVMSMVLLASIGLMPVSQAIAGVLIKWSLTGLFALAGALMVLVAAWLALNPGLRTLSHHMVRTTEGHQSQ